MTLDIDMRYKLANLYKVPPWTAQNGNHSLCAVLVTYFGMRTNNRMDRQAKSCFDQADRQY